MQKFKHRCAVLGKPIAHSLSPVLHMAAYERLGLHQWVYQRQEVDAGELEEFISSLDAQWAGLSLTMPLKQAVMSLGAPADRWSSALGVANTAVFDWSASQTSPNIALYNTDVQGIAMALSKHPCGQSESETSSSPDSMRQTDEATGLHSALILGSGNTATSALAACVELGIDSVLLCARHPDKAFPLAELAERFSLSLHIKSLSEAAENISGKDVVISTLPAHAADDFAEQLSKGPQALHGELLLDVVYDPRPTASMSAWRSRGGKAIGGEMMLLYQAIPQVAVMTGLGEQRLPTDLDMTMLQALQEVW